MLPGMKVSAYAFPQLLGRTAVNCPSEEFHTEGSMERSRFKRADFQFLRLRLRRQEHR